MSKQPYVNQAIKDEHEKDINAKRSLIMGWNSDDLEAYKVGVNSDGSLKTPGLDLPSNNPSITIAISTSGTVKTTTIQKTIGSDVYQKTIIEDSSDNSTVISKWSKV